MPVVVGTGPAVMRPSSCSHARRLSTSTQARACGGQGLWTSRPSGVRFHSWRAALTVSMTSASLVGPVAPTRSWISTLRGNGTGTPTRWRWIISPRASADSGAGATSVIAVVVSSAVRISSTSMGPPKDKAATTPRASTPTPAPSSAHSRRGAGEAARWRPRRRVPDVEGRAPSGRRRGCVDEVFTHSNVPTCSRNIGPHVGKGPHRPRVPSLVACRRQRGHRVDQLIGQAVT